MFKTILPGEKDNLEEKMICFPNAKINLGLHVKRRRDDGYHELETVFYPLTLSDVLEITPLPGKESEYKYSNTGIMLDPGQGDDLCISALKEIDRISKIPGVSVHLHKVIPIGAGLGGGSSDAAYTLRTLNDLFHLGISLDRLETIAGRIGSDCPFFIRNKPVFAKGRGDVFEPVDINLSGMDIMVVHPGIAVSSRWAYSGIRVRDNSGSVAGIVRQDPADWQGRLLNDFEPLVFKTYPVIKRLRDRMLSMGATYASMSGSGSAVFGLFYQEPGVDEIQRDFPGMFIWTGKL